MLKSFPFLVAGYFGVICQQVFPFVVARFPFLLARALYPARWKTVSMILRRYSCIAVISSCSKTPRTRRPWRKSGSGGS